MRLRLLLLGPALLLAACATRTIAGTQIADTKDTRAIIQVMETYRTALEARDAQAIQRLVSKNFRDNAGTEMLDDDLTYENLPQALNALFSRLDTPRVEMDVRRVDVREGTAVVIYHWNASWRMPALKSNAPQRESELEQMVLERQDGQWRIVSGL
jgi:ketosteroid isomerase-like protein